MAEEFDLQVVIAKLSEHARGMWKFRWQGVSVAWALALVGWTFILTMPDIYEASAKVSLDTNELLPELTRGLTASESLVNEVDIVSKALLTRPNLEAVARETDLDLRAADPAEMEQLITNIQARLRIRGQDRIFTISFQDFSRQKATEVVGSLLNTFVESSLRAQGDESDLTAQALSSEIDDHERRLLAAEADLADFKKSNIGYMPDEGADYYTRLQAALSAVNESARALRIARQSRDELVRQFENETGARLSGAQATFRGCSRTESITKLESELALLRLDFTDKHPRIVMLMDTISVLQERCADELAQAGPAPSSPSPTGSTQANSYLENLKVQLGEANLKLTELQEIHTSNQGDVAKLRSDVDKIADVEMQLKRLNRDYSVVESRHQELLRRWESLQSKKRLDPVTDQVQFTVMEPPFSPATPVEPNRPLMMIAALVMSIGAGAGLAFGLHQLCPTFFTRTALVQKFGIPVLGSVTLIESSEQRNRFLRRSAYWITVNVGLLGLAVVVILFHSRLSVVLRAAIGDTGL